MDLRSRPSNLLAIILLAWINPLVADNHRPGAANFSTECINHLIELAGLVKQLAKVTESIVEKKSELHDIQQQGDDLSDEARELEELIQNLLQNLEQERSVRLVALNSKSDRVLRHCGQ